MSYCGITVMNHPTPMSTPIPFSAQPVAAQPVPSNPSGLVPTRLTLTALIAKPIRSDSVRTRAALPSGVFSTSHSLEFAWLP
jgi:hypothetical protein